MLVTLFALFVLIFSIVGAVSNQNNIWCVWFLIEAVWAVIMILVPKEEFL